MTRFQADTFTPERVADRLAIQDLIHREIEATQSLANNAQRQSDVLLAQLCAENELVKIRLARQMPPVGEQRVACRQGTQDFTVAVTVAPTPNPNFLRVDAQVSDAVSSVLRVSTIVGRF